MNTRKKIWLSTYFTLPPHKWNGKEVVWVHDMIYELFSEIMPKSSSVIRMKKAAIEGADIVFCISNTTAKDLQRIYPFVSDKIIICHLSHDEIFSLRDGTKINNPITYKFILYLGKRKHYKGFDTLLEAYLQWSRNKEIQLIIVGNKWNQDEKEFLERKNLEDKIVLIEKIEDDFLCDIYNQAEALIYPSLYEGFGIPLLEAMACGCPIIASRIPSTIEVAGDVPIYFEPGEPESLLDALNFLISEDDVETRIEYGLEKASQYSWIKTAQTFYKGLLELSDND